MGKGKTPDDEKNKQDDLKDSVHRIWLAGLGALAAAEEEGSKLFSKLVDRGRDVESKGKVEVDKVNEKVRSGVDKAKAKAESAFENWGEKFDEKLTSALHRLGVPSRDEIHNLTKRVEDLSSKVENLKPRTAPAAPKTKAV
ncbi:MAG TPA: phasin family protein [Thermoanaerobaculia bacterium]|nr:phasin family protein [Thermoanaerobaculia bacterium]